MDYVLLGGVWMPPDAWETTVRELESQGHRGFVVTLPGQGDGNLRASLDDQIRAAVAAVDQADKPWVVGHSAACTLAWLAADRRPGAVTGVAMIGGFPNAEGEQYAAFLPLVDGAMPFPGWQQFAGVASDDISQEHKNRFARDAIAVPEGVAHAVVRYENPDRIQTPVVVICPEFSPAEAKKWIDAGDLPEIARVRDVTFVNLDAGHWPMISQPVELAATLDRLSAPTP